MKVADLRLLAEQLGVEIGSRASKDEILSEFEELGITSDYVKTLKQNYEVNKEDDESTKETPSTKVSPVASDALENYSNQAQLLKMVGHNFSMQVLGYSFTRKNPFNVMSSSDAQKIIDFYPDKFRIANPKEAQEFYA